MPAPGRHQLEVEATFPTAGRECLDLMMAVWSPGFYKVENYATRVESISARTEGGTAVALEHPAPNRWRAVTTGLDRLVVSYRLACAERSVTTNWVGDGYAVLNGPATFITAVGEEARPHEVRLELPKGWREARTALPPSPSGRPRHYLAPDFDTLVDSPIVAGNPLVRSFEVGGVQHALVAVGDTKGVSLKRAAKDLARMVAAHRTIWGELPFDRYEFLLVFRAGGGGLEHGASVLATAHADDLKSPKGHARWLGFISHEYCHAFNVKRLRPVELGPFDYEREPRTPSLWISEGFTTWFGELALVRAGLMEPDRFLSSLSRAITDLQRSPGRLVQTVEEASLGVWESESISGIGGDAEKSVSYYVKGQVLAFLLDAEIRRATGGERTLQDVMRLTYRRFGGERGFRQEEFRAAASEVAGKDLEPWFRRATRSTEELDYAGALEWYGLRFAPGTYTLERRPDAGGAEKKRLAPWTVDFPG